jgi:hypothetical protein
MSQNLTLGITSIATTFITTEIMGRHLMHRESGRHRQKRKIKPEGEPEGLPKFKKQIAIVSTVGPRKKRLGASCPQTHFYPGWEIPDSHENCCPWQLPGDSSNMLFMPSDVHVHE